MHVNWDLNTVHIIRLLQLLIEGFFLSVTYVMVNIP